jgi:hypothetical protein
MTQIDTTAEDLPEDLPEEIVQWQPQHGRTFAIPGQDRDGAVVVAATIGALALLGITAGAFLAGRRSGQRRYDS